VTPDQRRILVEACESGDDVRIVTIALQIAATLARDKRVVEALAIRKAVDDHNRQDSEWIEWKRVRLQVASQLIRQDMTVLAAITQAAALMRANEREP
jgi:hypothetical protein